jgi:hypothetical protein
MGFEMDNATARVMGGIYIALLAAVSDEGARLANDVLYGLADSPIINPVDARIYKLIADSASQEASERPQLELVTGGAA